MKIRVQTFSSTLEELCNVKTKSRRIAAISRNLVIGPLAIMGLLAFPMHLRSSELEPTQAPQASCGVNLQGEVVSGKYLSRNKTSGESGICTGIPDDCPP